MANSQILPSGTDREWVVPRQGSPSVQQPISKAEKSFVSNRVSEASCVRPQRMLVPVIHAGIDRLPPMPAGHILQPFRTPVRVGFVLNTFSFGGSETETIELVNGADPRILRFTGIAMSTPLPLPDDEPCKDGSFPPIYTVENSRISADDPRVKIVRSFHEAVKIVAHQSDVIITWGLHNLQEYLPVGPLPRIVVHSKDSGDWARSFLHPASLVTRYYVGNSSLAAAAFPGYVHGDVRVIHDGINPRRLAPRLSRVEQRRQWGFVDDDIIIVGYLGRIERDKGVSKTVDAVSRLGSKWKAVFVGANPNSQYASELWQRCEEAIPGRYRLLPWCCDVGSALAAFDVFCHPSEHEGFSNSIGEAWLAGVPTVYTKDTGTVPDLGELGIGVSARGRRSRGGGCAAQSLR